ncbi:MAG TPA: hypothetical protein VIH90_06935 [Candidatus Saccharimonadales bacterium]
MAEDDLRERFNRVRVPRRTSLSNRPTTIHDGVLVPGRPSDKVVEKRPERTLPRSNTLYTQVPESIDTIDEKAKHKKITFKWAVIIVIVPIVVILGLLSIYFLRSKTTTIPEAVKSQVNFPIMYPSDSSLLTVKPQSIKYNSSDQQLTFVAMYKRCTVSFSEQPTPSSFIDVPTVYTTLVTNLNEYTSFESINGSVYLLLPKELAGAQSAVMNSKGTLMFARPISMLTVNEWKQIFNDLQVLK